MMSTCRPYCTVISCCTARSRSSRPARFLAKSTPRPLEAPVTSAHFPRKSPCFILFTPESIIVHHQPGGSEHSANHHTVCTSGDATSDGNPVCARQVLVQLGGRRL